MKKFYLLFLFLFSFYNSNSQNAIIGSGFTNGWNIPADLVYFDQGVGNSRIVTLNPRGTGNQYFRLVRGWNGDNTQFGPFGCTDLDWTNPGVVYGTSVCNGGAFYINCPNVTDNYVFKTPNGPSSIDLLYFRIEGNVRNLLSISQLPSASTSTVGTPTTITAELDGNINNGQAVYLRYTNNNFTTSTVVQMTGSNSTFVGTIPSSFNTLNASISYYVFTSGTNNVNSDGSNADFYSINLNNNGGTNYNYTVINSTSWNGTSWTNTVGPNEQVDALIVGNYSTVLNGEFSANKVVINTGGSLTISSNTSINVTNEVDNTLTAAEFVIEDKGNLIQSNDITNIGDVSVTSTTSTLMRQDYVLWSAPVTGQQLQSFSPGTLANRFYTYNSGTNFYEVVASPSLTNFSEGTGYLIRVPNNHPTTPTVLSRTFTGVANNGDLSLALASGTWNAVGNPYPSTLNADEFITANSLTQPLYFWRKTNNSVNPSYATYTLAGGAGTAANTGGGSTTIPDGTIAVGQGFLAQATSGSLNFSNAMRNGDLSTQFFRSTSNDRSRVWLNLFNDQDFENQAMIAYMPSATNEIDAAIDGRFFENDIATQLSSLINGEAFAVQGRATFTPSDVVAIGFKAETQGNYSIAVDHVDGLFTNGQEVFLKDYITNVVHNLSASAYNFTSTVGTFNNRFEVVYQTNLATENSILNENSVQVFKQNQDIIVNTGSIKMKNVQVYDIQGRLLVEMKDINASTTKFTVGATNQVILVKVTSVDNAVVTKKVIN